MSQPSSTPSSDREDAPDLLSIGQHCSVSSCGQVDFLPFRCDCCHLAFCLDHRTYTAHGCKAAGARTTEVIVCPLCARGVRLQPGQDPNAAFEAHTASTACDPRNYAKVHKKPRCPVPRCQEKLSLTNTYTCKGCGQRVCLKHRMPDDHACAQAKAARQEAALASQRAQAAASRPPSAPARPPVPVPVQRAAAAAAQRQTDSDPGNSVKGTAQRRMQQLQQQQQQKQQSSWGSWGLGSSSSSSGAPAASNANPLVPPHLPEECPQCRARFASVERLIQHVEEWHPATTTASGATQGIGENRSGATRNPLAALGFSGAAGGHGGPNGGSGEVYHCHHCRTAFSDPVALVQHSERCGQQQQRTAVAGGGGGGAGQAGKSECTVS